MSNKIIVESKVVAAKKKHQETVFHRISQFARVGRFLAAMQMFDFFIMVGGADMFMSSDGLVPPREVDTHAYIPNMFMFTYDVTAIRVMLVFGMLIQALWFIARWI